MFVNDLFENKKITEGSAQDRLYRRHQELRKKSGLPDPDYYKELKASYDIEDDAKRIAAQAEIKKKYRVEEALSRRDFLKGMGAAAVVGAAGDAKGQVIGGGEDESKQYALQAANTFFQLSGNTNKQVAQWILSTLTQRLMQYYNYSNGRDMPGVAAYSLKLARDAVEPVFNEVYQQVAKDKQDSSLFKAFITKRLGMNDLSREEQLKMTGSLERINLEPIGQTFVKAYTQGLNTALQYWKEQDRKNLQKEDVAEAGPFSYGAKKPRKGSVADLAAKKRKEQEKNKKPIEPRDQMVGTARVIKDVSEDFDDMSPHTSYVQSKRTVTSVNGKDHLSDRTASLSTDKSGNQRVRAVDGDKLTIDTNIPKGVNVKMIPQITNEDVEQYLEEMRRAGYDIVTEAATLCPECGGTAYADQMLAEKQDACYSKVKSRYKVWPSAYASGALVRCRKVGAKNWGNKSKK